jgi:AcrR family transcriptional regulator
MAAGKKRLTREQSKALTQEKILAAAAKAFARQGFAGTAVDDIAETAGFSRGAFYSNFASKDELFLRLIELQLRFLTDDAHAIITDSSSGEETLDRLRKFYITMRSQDKDAFLLITEAQLYAIRNVRFRAKLASIFRKVHDELTASIEHLHQQCGGDNPIPPAILAYSALALAQGLMLYSMMDSKTYPEEMLSRASELVFDRMMLPGIETK